MFLFFILQLACREPSVAMIPPQARSCKTVEDVIQGLFFLLFIKHVVCIDVSCVFVN